MEQIITNNPKRDCPQMTVAVGKAIYRIGIHFNGQGNETLEDKLKQLLIMELQSNSCENE